MNSPLLRQSQFRGRNDDVTLNSATWNGGGGLNTNWTQTTTANFRVRFTIQEYNAGGGNHTFRLYYSHNGGAYTQVTSTSSVIRVVDSSQYADGDATSQLLSGTGAFVGGVGDDSDAVMPTAGNISIAASGNTEVEINLRIQEADVANTDTIALRVYYNSGSALDNYAVTPSLTVSKPQAYTLTADAGSYTYTGQSATILRSRVLPADAGSYTYTGQNASILRGYVLPASAGAYTYTGQSATITHGYVFTADAGSYAYTGQSATITYTPVASGGRPASTSRSAIVSARPSATGRPASTSRSTV